MLNDEQLKSLIRDTIQEQVKAAMRPTLVKLDNIQGTIDRIGNELDGDRKDFADMKANQATTLQICKDVLDMISRQTQKMVDKVEAKAQETMQEAAEVAASAVEPAIISASRKIKNGKPLQGRPWWRIW